MDILFIKGVLNFIKLFAQIFAGGWQRRVTFRMDTANQEMDRFLTEEMGYVSTITEPNTQV